MVAKDKATRDANLDALKAAADTWIAKEIIRIENETKFMRTVLAGRGASNAAITNLEGASALVQAEITSFLATKG